MAAINDQFRIQLHVCPSRETMDAILALLNVWQECNPDLMVAMVPAKDKYQYEIIQRGAGGNG